MGILDSKTRIIDTIITAEGKRQMSTGQLRAQYYSFTDAAAFYVLDTSPSGAIEASDRIYFEASNLPQDQVTFEADDSGKLMKFGGAVVNVVNGQILTGSLIASNNSTGKRYTSVSGSEFASLANDLLDTSLDNFKKLYIIGSPDFFNENKDQFLLDTNNIVFTITDNSPISFDEHQIGNLETTDKFFQDRRLSHVENFKFLPPVNKKNPGDAEATSLGNFINIGQNKILEFADIEEEIKIFRDRGFSKTITFLETSPQNNLFCQMFEIDNKQIIKLDVIDFGLFNVKGEDLNIEQRKKIDEQISLQQRHGTTKHVFFAGKIFKDNTGSNKFLNLFTLIFENN